LRRAFRYQPKETLLPSSHFMSLRLVTASRSKTKTVFSTPLFPWREYARALPSCAGRQAPAPTASGGRCKPMSNPLEGFTQAEITAIARDAAEVSKQRSFNVCHSKAQARQDAAWSAAVMARRKRAASQSFAPGVKNLVDGMVS